jgi:hypothetical protein
MPEPARLHASRDARLIAVGKVTATATRDVAAPPDRVLEFLRDYRDSRPRILTDNYAAYRVEQGGNGGGTVIGYHFSTGRRERDYRLVVEESDGGLVERDELSSFVSAWTVAPAASGSAVTVEGSWDGAGGVGGIFEGLFAPMVLRKIYGQVLEKLAAAVAA